MNNPKIPEMSKNTLVQPGRTKRKGRVSGRRQRQDPAGGKPGGRAEEHQGGRNQARPRHTPHTGPRPAPGGTEAGRKGGRAPRGP